MACPKCNCSNTKVHEVEVTELIRFRVVTYKRSYTECQGCHFEYYSPTQLDQNNSLLRQAYKSAVS